MLFELVYLSLFVSYFVAKEWEIYPVRQQKLEEQKELLETLERHYRLGQQRDSDRRLFESFYNSVDRHAANEHTQKMSADRVCTSDNNICYYKDMPFSDCHGGGGVGKSINNKDFTNTKENDIDKNVYANKDVMYYDDNGIPRVKPEYVGILGTLTMKVEGHDMCPYTQPNLLKVYLASPYSDKSKKVMKQREREITRVAAFLLDSHNVSFFLPITQSAPMARFNKRLKGDFETWKDIDLNEIRLRDETWVVTMPGYKKSVGVQAEIKYAKSVGKVVRYISPKTLKFVNEPKPRKKTG